MGDGEAVLKSFVTLLLGCGCADYCRDDICTTELSRDWARLLLKPTSAVAISFFLLESASREKTFPYFSTITISTPSYLLI